MKPTLIAAALLVSALLMHQSSYAQFLKKLKEKAQQMANKKTEEQTGANTDANNNNANTSSTGKPTNKTGEGLKNTAPPDVMQQISDAETANTSGNYSDARYSIQQALLGVEIQIGQQILKSLPETVSNLPKDTAQDRVVSTRWGWANLTIQRIYVKDDKQLTVTVGNNSVYGGMIDLYFNNAYATQSNGDKQDMKQIKIKGNKGVIKFDQNEGYTLLVQLGQSGLITWQGINYANENEITAAANSFDIDGIKKMLGEQ